MASIDYIPPKTIAQMLQSKAYIRGVCGCLGSGKSVGCSMALLKNAMEQAPSPRDGLRRSRMVVIRNTFRMLNDTTIKTVHEWLPPGVAGKWKDSTKTLLLKFQDIESEWLFRPLESPDDVRNLLSLEITSAWINEYREIDPGVLAALLGRLGRSPRKADTEGHRGAVMRGVVMDSNPPPVGSYWHDLFEEALPEDIEQAFKASMKNAHPDERERPIIEYFKQPGGRHPEAENLDNLPDGYYELLVAANAHHGQEWIDVHVDAHYGRDPSNMPVYPEFRPHIHAPKPSPLLVNPKQPLILGMDFGRTPAAVVLQETLDGGWNALRELVSENTTIDQFVQKLIPWFRQNFPEHSVHESIIYADPAGMHRSQTDNRECFSILRGRGFTVRPGPQSPVVRIGSVRHGLTTLIGDRPMLMVDPVGCPTLYKGFAGIYSYKINQEGEMNPEPRKNAVSHPHDALQYPLAAILGPTLRTGQKTEAGERHINKPITKAPTWRVFS